MPNIRNNDTPQLFRRMSWKQYLALDVTDKTDNQIIYIADKDIRAQVYKDVNAHGEIIVAYDIIFNNQYGFIANQSLGNLQENEARLTPGIYILYHDRVGNQKEYAEAYFYDGGSRNTTVHWFPLAIGEGGSGSGGVTRVNGRGPDDEGNVTIEAQHINAVFTDGSVVTIQEWLEQLQEQVDQKAWLKQTHQYYDPVVYEGGTSNTYTQFDRGNLQISGYLEGRVDGGEW